MQTSREVIDNLLRGRPAERVGLHDSPWADTLRKWTAEGYPRDDNGDPADPVDHFGFDMAGAGGWFDILLSIASLRSMMSTSWCHKNCPIFCDTARGNRQPSPVTGRPGGRRPQEVVIPG